MGISLHLVVEVTKKTVITKWKLPFVQCKVDKSQFKMIIKMSWNAKKKPMSVIPQKCFEQLQNFARQCLQNELETHFLMINVQYKSHMIFSHPKGRKVQNLSQNFFWFRAVLVALRKTDIQTQFGQLCERRYTACYRNPGPKKVDMQLAEKASKIPAGLI